MSRRDATGDVQGARQPSTLDGTYSPTVGATVWQQMYSPTLPTFDASITERVAAGETYCPRRLMIVTAITETSSGLARWVLTPADPADRRGEFPNSIVESDWCVLEAADQDDAGTLF